MTTFFEKKIYLEHISRYKEYYLVLGLSLLSFGMWLFFYSQNLTLAYNDARSHLNVARRVVDSLNPGFAQIGSVWLPLFHILELPMIWNDFLYRSGLAGSIISMLAFVGSGVFMYRLARLFGFDGWGVVACLLAFTLNLNLLFLQSTPMTESLMIFTLLGATYFIMKWILDEQLIDLIFSSMLTFFAILTRYDGWFLFIFISLAVLVVSIKRHGWRRGESNLLIYALPGAFAIFIWVFWNALIFGDPLYFVTGPFSAKAQQDLIALSGGLHTKGNLLLSSYTYILAAKENIGLYLSIIGTLGILIGFIFMKRKSLKVVLFLLVVPLLFHITSLYFGHSVIHLPQIEPYSWFNDRYGVMALPLVAIGIGYIGNKKALASLLLIGIIISQASLMVRANHIISIEDAARGSSGNFLTDIGNWIGENAKNGMVLAAASSNDGLIFMSNLPLRQFITEGSGKYWDVSLKNPTLYAKYIIWHSGDLVSKKLKGNSKFEKNYVLVFRGEFADVYKRIGVVK